MDTVTAWGESERSLSGQRHGLGGARAPCQIRSVPGRPAHVLSSPPSRPVLLWLPEIGRDTNYIFESHSEARSIHAGLKTLFTRDDLANYREAEFQHKNLRHRYLHLPLFPSASQSRDAGTHLWMQASYALITLYKQRLARPQAHNTNNAGAGTVEARRLLQRFRQFLADEERFWRALVLRR
ncbi:hypothetical protein DFH07DRAFT_384614 [Mycena maculata]|uniref:Telomerase activating protein Est1-like N-terminal domain-containing protein n=1 Tax=Mycena maculata TaxID=230809 RepID=A0AAD7JGM9_9AGAR|nr:hypothetical protein DFH07DRAFT_384614 [Mycena maculata]